MDIENMHPFCLPFGFCHDATSSSIAATDFGPDDDDNAMLLEENTSGTTTSKSNNSSNSILKQQITSSLLDDDDDNLIRISSSSPIGANSGDFYSLELDMNGQSQTDNLFAGYLDDMNKDEQELDELNEEEEEERDWYCNQFSLLSPPAPMSLHQRRKSLLRATTNLISNNHQVFHHHVVDTIDIKSSPTLAQLNLNSQDDPTGDGLWSSAGCNPNSTLSSSHLDTRNGGGTSESQTNSHIDLLSNCTSISINHRHLPGAHHHLHHHHLNQFDHNSTSNHLHHQTQNQNQNQNRHNNCGHHHHHHQPYHHHCHLTSTGQLHSGRCCGPTSTCLGGQHYKKPDLHQYSPSCCQHNLLASTNLAAAATTTTTTTATATSNSTSSCSANSLQPSSAINNGDSGNSNILVSNVLNQQPFNINRSQLGSSSQQTQQQQLEASQKQKRSASPALVTSSSSPLSSSSSSSSSLLLANQQPSSVAQQQQHQQPQQLPENRLVDNKLKENIEYLTALLCNGSNKLEGGQAHHHQQQAHQQPQQQHHLQPSSISTTMVRPSTTYATLAHSLSTGPKLLERHQQHPALSHQNTQQHLAPANGAPRHIVAVGANEASTTCGQEQQQQQGVKRPYHPADQWQPFNPSKVSAVESSVSAADSTGESSQVTSQQRQPELKVLSSLLSANRAQPQDYTGPVATGTWQEQQRLGGYHSHSHSYGQVVVVVGSQSSGPSTSSSTSTSTSTSTNSITATTTKVEQSIPANGKPITLTPIASTIVPQQQQKPRFVQPASPSASSTGSSVEIIGSGSAAATSGHQAIKRAKPGVSQLAVKVQSSSSSSSNNSNNNNNRLGRQNSMSTDCSQTSSHDEGFSSQMDQDECGSQRDSDSDEDEADSDDESFYGDYTNNDLIGASISDNAENKWTLNMGRTRRNGQKRYFWQYNVQSKGPKGTRICSTDDPEDPFILPEASDPVFSNDCQVEGVKHSGKARRGDGNDLTPNPRKLLMIGLELKKLGKIINELAPVTDLPVNVRNKTRKEKNKLASRACRLKKKAQHEANKIKLYGLQREHQQVVLAIYDVRKLLNESLLELDNNNKLATSSFNNNNNQQKSTATSASVKTIAEQCSMTVAGQTSDYVNSVLEKVVSGCIDGGLQT